MKTSTKGVAFIAAHEGVVTKAYKDSAGIWTIGVGHTAAAGGIKPVRGMVITRQQALDILAEDLPKFEKRVSAAMPNVGQAPFDGGSSFDFNTGAIHKASWVKLYLAGSYMAAKASLALWNKAGGRTVPGLTRRRQDEDRLIFNGDYGAIDSSIIGTGAAPSASQTIDEVKDYQQDLATLGYYRGKVDGIAGPASRSAVLAYQKSHPDLVDDGIVGPATRASLERDVKAKSAATQAATVGTATAAVAGAVVEAAGGSDSALLWWALGIGVACAAAIGLFIYLKNRR